MRWVDVKGETEWKKKRQKGRRRGQRPRERKGETHTEWLRPRESARDREKQGVSKKSQVSGETERTRGRPCFSQPFALGQQLGGIPGTNSATQGSRHMVRGWMRPQPGLPAGCTGLWEGSSPPFFFFLKNLLSQRGRGWVTEDPEEAALVCEEAATGIALSRQ